MGFFSRLRDKVKSGYSAIDSKVFRGALPGGAPKASAPSSSSSNSSSSNSTSSNSTSSNSSSSSSGGSSRSGGGSSSGSSTPTPTPTPVPTEINVLKSGGVRVGKVTYIGNAVVPFTDGKTANQIQQETFRQARSQGITKRGTYSATIPINQQSALQPTNQTSSSQLQQELNKIQQSGQSYALEKPTNQTKASSKPFYVSTEGRKGGASMGALFVTPAEAKKLKGSGTAYWELESNNTKDALEEAQFAFNTPYVTRAINTRGVYEANMQNILAGKETYRQYKGITSDFQANPEKYEGQAGVTVKTTDAGKEYSLTPEYFSSNINSSNIYSNALTGAKTSFKELPKGTRRKLNVQSYGQGIAQAGVGIIEFGGTVAVNLGQQTFTQEQLDKGEFGKTRRFYFSENKPLGEIATYPTIKSEYKFTKNPGKYLGQKVTSPDTLGQATVIVPLVAQGASSAISNIKNLGWKAGATETLSGFSPIRIKSGIYAEPLNSKTKFKIDSIKYTDQAGITTRVYGGTSTSGNIKVSGYERSALVNGQRVGSGFSTTQTPYTEIRGGGAIIKSGVRSTTNPYTFRGAGSGSGYKATGNNFYTQILSPKFKAGTSDVLTSKGSTVYTSEEGSTIYSSFNKGYRTTGGSLTSKTGREGVTSFVSGKANPIYKTTYGDTNINLNTGQSSRDFIYSPSGKYKLNPQISGREYDLNKIFTGTQDKGFSSFSSGGKGSGSKLISTQAGATQAVIPTTLKPVTVTKTPIIPPQKTGSTKQQTNIQMSATQSVAIQAPKLDTGIKTSLGQATILVPQTSTKSRSRSRSKTAPAVITIPKPVTRPAIREKTKIKQVQVKKVKIIQSSALSGLNYYGASTPAINYGFTPSPVPLPIVPGLTGGISLNSGIGKVRARKSETRYTPSFSALFFKIGGSKPKGRRKTGINFRPITPDFGFTSRRNKKIIRLKKIRI